MTTTNKTSAQWAAEAALLPAFDEPEPRWVPGPKSEDRSPRKAQLEAELEAVKDAPQSYEWECEICGRGHGRTPPCPTERSRSDLIARSDSNGYDGGESMDRPSYPHTGKSRLTGSASSKMAELRAQLEELATLASEEGLAYARQCDAHELACREWATSSGPRWLLALQTEGAPSGEYWDPKYWGGAFRPIPSCCPECGARKGSCVHE